MSTPTSRNLYLTRGDDKYYILTFTDSNGDPIDITGWIIFFTVKRDLDDTDDEALIKKDITSHTDPTNGQTRIHLTNDDTDLIGSYYYDIQVKKSDGTIITILEGAITFKKDITQRTE